MMQHKEAAMHLQDGALGDFSPLFLRKDLSVAVK
jgi:hypothetical protein